MYQGDKIRIEQAIQGDLEEVAHLIRKNLNYDSLEVYFYHLDGNVLKNFSPKDLKAIQAILQN